MLKGHTIRILMNENWDKQFMRNQQLASQQQQHHASTILLANKTAGRQIYEKAGLTNVRSASLTVIGNYCNQEALNRTQTFPNTELFSNLGAATSTVCGFMFMYYFFSGLINKLTKQLVSIVNTLLYNYRYLGLTYPPAQECI